MKNELINTVNRKLIKKPPVGPISLLIPPLNPENTGSPRLPSAIQIRMQKNAEKGSSKQEQISTAKRPNEIGTGVKGRDMDKGESIHIKALIKAVNTSFFVDKILDKALDRDKFIKILNLSDL